MERNQLRQAVPVQYASLFLIIGAVACVLLRRIGFTGFLFLVPIGFIALTNAAPTAFGTAAAAMIFEAAALLVFIPGEFAGFAPVLFYVFTVMAAFAWIMVPPGFTSKFPVFRIRTVWRFIFSAALVMFFLSFFLRDGNGDQGFFRFLRSRAEMVSAFITASPGKDAVMQSFVEQYATADRIMEAMLLLVTRGGGLASIMALFFVNREASFMLVRLVRRQARERGGLRGFHAPSGMIWILSFSLPAILLSRIAGFEAAEIIAWNVLTACVLVFLAQGGGIALYLLGKKRPFRILLVFLILALVFSPGINAVALGILVLLGIAENWVPLRVPKTDGSSPTPGM
jgi:hypothetical protein